MSSRWKDISNFLTSAGYDVYSPAQHEGECTSRYIVLKVGTFTGVAGISSARYVYDLMVYVPKDEYSQLEEFVEEVKKTMKGMEPMIKPSNTQTGSYYDDSVKGHMISIQYTNARKL